MMRKTSCKSMWVRCASTLVWSGISVVSSISRLSYQACELWGARVSRVNYKVPNMERAQLISAIRSFSHMEKLKFTFVKVMGLFFSIIISQRIRKKNESRSLITTIDLTSPTKKFRNLPSCQLYFLLLPVCMVQFAQEDEENWREKKGKKV